MICGKFMEDSKQTKSFFFPLLLFLYKFYLVVSERNISCRCKINTAKVQFRPLSVNVKLHFKIKNLITNYA